MTMRRVRTGQIRAKPLPDGYGAQPSDEKADSRSPCAHSEFVQDAAQQVFCDG